MAMLFEEKEPLDIVKKEQRLRHFAMRRVKTDYHRQCHEVEVELYKVQQKSFL